MHCFDAFPVPLRFLARLAAFALIPAAGAFAAELQVFHADSLAGPMKELKKAFEAKHPGVTIQLTSGTSKALAARILKGDPCDVFAPSAPSVIDEDLMHKKAAGGERDAASWYVVFSANEMVLITPKGNPKHIAKVADLAADGVRFVRVTGDKDLATGRTIEFLKREAKAEGHPEAAAKILERSPEDPAKPRNVPDTVNAVKGGQADAGVVYYSAAVASRDALEIIRFDAAVNMSEAIRNAATVPGTAKQPKEATEFVAFLLSDEARAILKATGQPPVAPALRRGEVPAAVPAI